jgi:hypothetical protein
MDRWLFHRKSSPGPAVCLGGEAFPNQPEVVLREHPPHGCSKMYRNVMKIVVKCDEATSQ